MTNDDTRPDKALLWVGNSLKNLKKFPADMRIDAGHELRRVQEGKSPTTWKPFQSAGPGAHEIILRDQDGWYRVIYVAKFEEGVYVLHVFQKKTNKTSQSDVDEAEKAYRTVLKQRTRK